MPYTRVDGVDYTTESVEQIRAQMITLRGEALDRSDFGAAVTLTWNIAYLAEYIDLLHDPHIADIIHEWRRHQ